MVLLSNTNRLHCNYWPQRTLKWPPPPIISICRKISAANLTDIYRHVLAQKKHTAAADAVLLMIRGEQSLAAHAGAGIKTVHVTDLTLPAYLSPMSAGRVKQERINGHQE